MSGSCYLDRASNVKIGVECQIFVTVTLFKCGRALQFGAHLRYHNPIPTGHGQNQPIYERHVTTAGRNRVNSKKIFSALHYFQI